MALLSLMEVEDIKEFTCENNTLSIKASNNVSFDMPTEYTDSDGNTVTTDWILSVYLGEGNSDLIGTSFEEVKKYLDAGLAKDISISTYSHTDMMSEVDIEDFYLVLPDTDTYMSLMSEEEKEKYMVGQVVIPAYEQYIKDTYGYRDYDSCNLIYIDSDNTPELLFDNSGDGRGTVVLTYQNGTVLER